MLSKKTNINLDLSLWFDPKQTKIDFHLLKKSKNTPAIQNFSAAPEQTILKIGCCSMAASQVLSTTQYVQQFP